MEKTRIIFTQPTPSRLRENLEVIFKYPNMKVKKMFNSRKRALMEYHDRWQADKTCEMLIESIKA